jgi:hypothetical protein
MKRLLILASLVLLSGALALADTISGGTLVNFPGTAGTGTSGVQGSPYWNNFSLDGTNKNIGYFLTGTGGFTGGPNFAPTKELTDGTNNSVNAATNFRFVRNSASLQITLLGTFANFATTAAGTPFDTIGWYETDSTGTVNGTKHQLFGPGQEAANVGVGFSFNPTAFYGFYLTTCISVNFSNNTCNFFGTFYTNSNFNNAVEYSDFVGGTTILHQHFAAFGANALLANNESYYLGVEDSLNTFGQERYGDFNDIIISIASVPEPATYGLMGAGLVGLALLHRRMRSKK